MIRVILQGRTGNNLFQYAAGRALAEWHGTELILDGAWVNPAQARIFEHLLRLPIKARYERRHSVLKRLGRRTFKIGPGTYHRCPVIIDPDNGTVPDLRNAADNTVLIGFFQSPIYFTGMENFLQSELDLSVLELPSASRRFEEGLNSTPTVSIHVRRGDYVGIESTHCLSADYHEVAINWFRERMEDVRFCVFSDDIDWCRGHFLGPQFIFCDSAAAASDPLHDMRLMSSCHHHIIVNSSYSWWGAWLNPSPSKHIVAPKMWMKSLPAKTVLPDSWINLSYPAPCHPIPPVPKKKSVIARRKVPHFHRSIR